MSVARRIEDDARVASAASNLAFGERDGVVHDPADRPLRESRTFGIEARPPNGGTRGVHVGDGGSGPCHREGREARVREEMEDRGRFAAAGPRGHLVAQPGQHRGVLRKEPDLASIGRAELEGDPVDLDRPRPGFDPRPTPPAVAVEPQIGRPPQRRVGPRPERAR